MNIQMMSALPKWAYAPRMAICQNPSAKMTANKSTSNFDLNYKDFSNQKVWWINITEKQS